MTTTALSTAELSDAPRLRLLPSRESEPAAPSASGTPATAGPPALHLVHDPAPEDYPVLVAGRDSARRIEVLRDLTESMSPSTTFVQAGAFWEVLVRAPASSMVILSGELDDVPAESLLHMLAHRHPGLPVVTLDASMSA